MHAVSAAELLDLWEWGVDRNPVERGLALLAAAWPWCSLDELSRLPIGRRDARLLQLRATLFGSDLAVETACLECREPLELVLRTSDLVAAAGPDDDGAGACTAHTLEADGRLIRFRLPDSLDLLDAIASPEPRRTLLERCVSAGESSAEAEADRPILSAEAQAVLASRMQALDPLASASFDLTCPACAHTWVAPLDVLSYLWSEIGIWAHRTLREVHWLACAYGWREGDILAVSAWRRRAYLQLSGHA